MNFSEWAATYCNGMLLDGDTEDDRLVRLVARETWKAAESYAREELLTKFNRTGVDIDAALHGRVNEQSPIANRLRMIAAAQPQWRPIETAPKNGWPFIASHAGGRPFECYRGPHGDLLDSKDRLRDPTAWTPMPLPPPPEETITGEKEQEARDVTE